MNLLFFRRRHIKNYPGATVTNKSIELDVNTCWNQDTFLTCNKLHAYDGNGLKYRILLFSRNLQHLSSEMLIFPFSKFRFSFLSIYLWFILKIDISQLRMNLTLVGTYYEPIFIIIAILCYYYLFKRDWHGGKWHSNEFDRRRNSYFIYPTKNSVVLMTRYPNVLTHLLDENERKRFSQPILNIIKQPASGFLECLCT